jgi:hypothetical protein
MAEVAKADGIRPSMGQSPFALARGQTFEKSLFWNEAASLLAELLRAEVLPKKARGFLDLRLSLNGGRLPNLDVARARTKELLAAVAQFGQRKGPRPPALVAGATVCIPGGVMLPEAILVIDALVIRSDLKPPQLVVGEIKTYPDRGGYTDRAELATARAQLGVYVHGLRVVLEQELGLKDAVDIAVAEEGFLVLSRPGFSKPSVRAGEDLRHQAVRAERGFVTLREVADEFSGKLYEAPLSEQTAAVRKADFHYQPECWTFCDRAPVCHRRALEAGNASVLGDDVARFLGEITLTRAEELMGGASPRNAAEKDLVRRIGSLELTGGRR